MSLEVEQLGARLLRPLLRSLHEASQRLGLDFEPQVQADAATEALADDPAAASASAPTRKPDIHRPDTRPAASQRGAAEPIIAPSRPATPHHAPAA
ncbi:hypothetical protein, partial [Chitiniphilus shinanonensis]|uniref:hypothetical protein n=1 Tax=Chitiniphilus shinanonensis TaxID=553088 RepID=UPI003342B577